MKKSTARTLVRYLELNVVKFRKVQEIMYRVSKRIKNKDMKNHKVGRGYACNAITLLVNSGAVKFHEDFGYYCVPGTHKNRYFYNTREHQSWHRERKDERPSSAISHPKIKKIIDTKKKNHEVYI